MPRTLRRTLLAALIAGLGAATSQAALIISFQFAGGGTTKEVPPEGGTYTVNIVASTTNGTTTNLGVNAGYIGALSSVLNGSTIDGDVTTSGIVGSPGAGLQGSGFNNGLLTDVNGDGRVDMGFANNTAKTTTGWMRPTTGGTSAVLMGGPTGVIGSFTVTIPANTSNGLDFLSYAPQLDPSGVGADWSWSEANAQTPLISGSVTGTGAGLVSAGTSVTFSTPAAVPEPGTLALGGVAMLGLAGWKLRRKKAQA